MRSIQLPREPGWIGGVCAGIAARLRIDPLIVRGIAVVLAILGAPALLAYALAWLVLPDRNGQIHAQELGRGHVTPALPAIVGIGLLSFLPLGQGFWYLGGIYWGPADVAGAVARAVWMAVLLAAIVVLVVWLARRATGDVTTGPATTDDRPETIPSTPVAADAKATSGTAAATAATPIAVSATGEPIEPAAPPADASADELAEWKRSQAEWQKQRAEWVAEQNRAEYELRQSERRAQSAAAAAAAVERRRIQRLVRPRASGAVVSLIVGLALVVGAVAAFVASGNPVTQGDEWAIGIAAGTTVVGLSAIIVGFARRRSGFLAFLGIVGVLSVLFTLIVPLDRRILPPGTNYAVDSTEDARVIQLGGTTSTWVSPTTGDAAVIDIWQLSGDVYIDMLPGAVVRLEAVVASGDAPTVTLLTTEGPTATATLRQTSQTGKGESKYSASIGGLAPDLTVRVWLGSGQIHVLARTEDEIPLLEIIPAPAFASPFSPALRGVDDEYIPFTTDGATR